MADNPRHRTDALSLLESLLGDAPPSRGDRSARARLAGLLVPDGPAYEALSPAILAAYLDGGLDPAERQRVAQVLATDPAALLDLLAGLDHVRAVEDAEVPVETFLPLAAASEPGSQAVLCRSQSGIWTLEIFVAPDDADKGYLLLTVHPDHRGTYEGRVARVFVKLGNDERVLAEEAVRDGELYSDISLNGLDLHTRDAVNVMFGPAAP